MKTIQNNPNGEYKKVLDEVLTKADLDKKEIWFMDIYNYLDKINKKDLMPFLLKDIKELGLEVILNKMSIDYKDYTVSK